MISEKCMLSIKRAIGKEKDISKDEIKQLAKTVGEMYEKIDKSNQVADISDEFLKSIDRYMTDLKTAAFIEKRNAIINESKRIQTYNYLTSVWGDNPKEGLKALFQGSLTPRQGSRNSLDTHVARKRNEYKFGLVSKLAQSEVLDIVKSGKHDDQLFTAMYELSKVVPDSKVVGGLIPEVVEAAKIMNDFMELSRVEANKSGAFIKKLEGRVLKRTHDSERIGLAAGDGTKLGSETNKKAWVDFVKQRLDRNKTFTDLPDAKIDLELARMYQDFVSNNHYKFEDVSGTPNGFKGAANLAKKVSKERVLFFKDSAAEYEYYNKFSKGENLLSGVLGELDRAAKNTAIMEKFGPNAFGNIDQVVAKWSDELKRADKHEDLAALTKEYGKIKNATIPIITDEINAGAKNTWAKRSAMVRKIMRSGDLAMAALTATGDFLSVAGMSRYMNDRSLGNFYSSLNKTISNVFGNFKKFDKETISLAKSFNIILDTVMPTSASRFEHDVTSEGSLSKFLDFTFKLNGISHLQDRLRLASVLIQGSKYADNIGKEFDKLPLGTQSWFTQNNISPQEWDILRGMELKKDSNGIKYLVVDTIDDVPLESFDILDSVKNSKNKDAARLKAKKDLKDKFGNSNQELAAASATEPSAADQRLITFGGTKAGTPVGELIRHMMMYKSFTTTLMRKHLGREIHGYDENRQSLAKALLSMFHMEKGGGYLVSMMPAAMVLGYTQLTMKDILKNKAPRRPEDFKDYLALAADSFLQTGALGIYGDFLFGDMKNKYGRSVVETLAGPTFGRVAELTDIIGSLKSAPFSNDFGREAENTANKIVRFAMNNTPGLNTVKNHFATNAGYNFLINYQFQEMLNHGYLKRMEDKLKREKRQEYLIRPSSVIKRGGGFK